MSLRVSQSVLIRRMESSFPYSNGLTLLLTDAGLDLLGSSSLLTSASQSAGITDVSYRSQLPLFLINGINVFLNGGRGNICQLYLC
ncbi:ssu-2 homolog [Homo sapiens]|uniref:HCG1994835 n=1 Tax=Homo sapiens TaxID=9606 RepID=G5E9S6_HUMAN|nr:hCG1994835 [Homo sapiens]KAI2528036.1 ssu-2-like protein [Homo sapiens]KAI4028099.1 ssu-2 homolog [Homo sapiens]